MSRNEEGIVLFASREVGCSILKFLIAKKDPVRFVVAAHRSDKALIRLARSRGIVARYYGPKTLSLLKKRAPFEWIISGWNEHILSDETLRLAKKTLNLHPAFVPDAQGSHTTTWTIRRDLPAGVSLIQMRSKPDTGCLYARRRLKTNTLMPASRLNRILKEELVKLFVKKWPLIHRGQIRPFPQRGKANCFIKAMTAKDRVKNGSEKMTVRECLRWILGHDFHPHGCARVRIGSRVYSLRVEAREERS